MAKTLAQIEEQIAKLQKQKEAIKAKEVSGVIERIKEAIAHYGLAPADLFGLGSGRKGRTTKANIKPRTHVVRRSQKGVRVPVKYRDGAGNTWTGRGNKPRWLVAALTAGKKVEDFAVKG